MTLLPCPPTAPSHPHPFARYASSTAARCLCSFGPSCTLDRWSFDLLVAVTAARSFILALCACCCSLCKPPPPTTTYPSCGASLPTWYAHPAKQPCYPNPPSPVAPPVAALVALLSLRRVLSPRAQQRNPCDPRRLPLPTAGPPSELSTSPIRPLSLVCPSHPIDTLFPTVLSSSRPCPSHPTRLTYPWRITTRFSPLPQHLFSFIALSLP